ncbi:MAG: 4Fe-4S dicluster domain-containing protein [Gammaproteobacteria bacterium]|jgi:ferredoxin|nr:4Fe-4S dicluster domain-containing protein [Gammaproteobacteria bacterium]MBU2426995.1 4Fe-4S dicluster domain-containing protein [Gammaproteobacteria bacterium]
MAYQILADCINCDMCAPECPNAAISLQQVAISNERSKRIFQIDAQLCTECEGFYLQPTCVEVCPIDVVIKA